MSVSLRESTANASCFAARHFVFEVLCALGVSAVRFCSQVILEVLNFMGEYGNSGVIHTHSTEPHRTDHIFAVSRQIAHLRNLFVPLVLYFALAILMTWPLALYVTRAVPGNGVDSWINMWNLWWLRRALMHGDNPYVTPMLYYPQGASLLLHTLNPINFLITLPVILTLNLTAAYNAAILASLTLCGLCTYLLALDVTGSRPAALVGGVVFACSGYLLSQVAGEHTHMVAAWPLPLAMLALRRTVHRPSLRNTLLAGLALGLNLLADWQYFLFILIWTGWYSCWIIDALRRRISRSAAIVPPPSYPQSGFRRYRCVLPQYPDDRQSRAR